MTYTVGIWECGGWQSSFNVTLTDKLPDNTMFVQNLSDMSSSKNPWNWTGMYSYYTTGPNWVPGAMPYGQTGPAYLRWVMRLLGPWTSAYVMYSVKVL